MAKVKGSKQQRMVVVPHSYWRTFPAKVLVVSTAILLGISLFTLGGALARSGVETTPRILSVGNGEKDNDSESLQERLIKAEQTASIDKLTVQGLQTSIARMSQHVAQLKEDVLFYKKITEGGDAETGLVVSKLDLLSTATPNHFLYKIKFIQAGDSEGVIEGYTNIAVSGVQDDADVTLPLSVLSNVVQGENIKLRFRSFQDVEGEVTLPAGFEPARVEILAVTEGPSSKRIQKNFTWVVESSRQTATDAEG
jgi:hypothetical protein